MDNIAVRGRAPRNRASRTLITLAVALILAATPIWAQPSRNENGNGGGPSHDTIAPAHGRNFDARIEANRGLDHSPSAGQSQAVERARQDAPGLLVRFEPTTGVTRNLSHPVFALTPGPVGGRTPVENAEVFVFQERELLGLDVQDLEGMEVTDEVFSRVSGGHHVYFRQTLGGLPVYQGQLNVNLNAQGGIQSVNNAFVPNLRRSANSLKAAKGAEEAVAAAAAHLEIDLPAAPAALSRGDDVQQTTLVDNTGLSIEPIEAKLFLLPINRGNARLVWNFQIHTADEQHVFEMNVDAVSGKVWTRFDLVSDAQYRVYAQPDESPSHGSQARSLEVDPHLAATNASPNGWHNTGSTSFTITRGNNVHAYEDRDANNAPPATEVNCGSSLNCDFSINLSQSPANYIPAAVTNLFYWNNLIHDVQYQHGFDEQAGNFQVNNFGRGGAGGDDVRAEAQDGSGNCNANFFTPSDGSRPRMQMFTCANTSPARDGDLDNGVIVHEYGHGISIRQVGGPSTSCLNNSQQPGEGWSDWFALAYTHEIGDAGTDKRGIGTYLFGQPATGDGIRPQPYSTDSAINNYTYSSIGGLSIPHGVGSVWAQAIWEVYWALVDKHGFDPNIYNPGNVATAAGNLRALTYVNEGLKSTACSPTFLDTRDGIITAAQNINGGEDVCTIWEAFAAFGLGTDASTGGSNSTSATNGFSVPAGCGGTTPTDPVPPACPAGSIDFNSFALTSYSNQNVSNNVTTADGGDTLVLRDNTWVRSTSTFNITSTTKVELYFAGGPQGEIHAIGFDPDDDLNNQAAHFQLWGTQNWTGAGNFGRTSPQYSGSGDFESFSLDASVLGTGNKFLVFTNDNDAGSGNESRFACVRVVDDSPPPTGECAVNDSFENGATGWFNDGASTCTTGAFVLATPTQQTSTVVTQPAGDHTSGGGNAIFTATNTSAGSNDVDGGVCILGSPTWTVTDASELSVWYFHGQRDTGDDPGGDFFSLEVSINGGAFTPFVSIGDTRTVASWTNATTSIPAGSSVQLRLRVSDGAGPGDIVEGGIDDLSICPVP